MIYDNQGMVQQWNQTCAALSGYTLEQLKGKPLWDVMLEAAGTGWL